MRTGRTTTIALRAPATSCALLAWICSARSCRRSARSVCFLNQRELLALQCQRLGLALQLCSLIIAYFFQYSNQVVGILLVHRSRSLSGCRGSIASFSGRQYPREYCLEIVGFGNRRKNRMIRSPADPAPASADCDPDAATLAAGCAPIHRGRTTASRNKTPAAHRVPTPASPSR